MLGWVAAYCHAIGTDATAGIGHGSKVSCHGEVDSLEIYKYSV
jgi:hypothetical protein